MSTPEAPLGLKIDKNIPIPPARGNLTGVTEAMRRMEVGDSFVCDISQRTNVTNFARRVGMKITTRRVSSSQVRVWKIE